MILIKIFDWFNYVEIEDSTLVNTAYFFAKQITYIDKMSRPLRWLRERFSRRGRAGCRHR